MTFPSWWRNTIREGIPRGVKEEGVHTGGDGKSAECVRRAEKADCKI